MLPNQMPQLRDLPMGAEKKNRYANVLPGTDYNDCNLRQIKHSRMRLIWNQSALLVITHIAKCMFHYSSYCNRSFVLQLNS